MREVIGLIRAVLPYAALLTVVVGAVSVTMTVIAMRRSRALTAAVQLVENLQTREFTESIVRVVQLPENADPKTVLANKDLLVAAFIVCQVFEGLGVLVFNRLLPLYLVDQLIGGYVRACWTRLGPHVHERRETIARAMYGEWFEWLAQRMNESPAHSRSTCAAVAHRRWRRDLLGTSRSRRRALSLH